MFSITLAQSEDLTKLGTFKDWNAVSVFNETGKICFAYSVPVRQSPKASNREARLFVSFRPEDKISDEVSITSGYDFNSQNTILATSGKSKFEFDLPQNKFAWISSGKTEQKIIKRMKKASRLMITAYKLSGTQTTDDYSLMGFTKAYNAAKKSCT
jgi:hypothetical protein